eukprot:9722383-Ditylum_brightwellii.AAC.1
MTYFIKTEGKKPQYLIRSIIYTGQENLREDTEYTKEEPILQTEVEEIEIEFLSKNKEEIVIGDEALDEPLNQDADDSSEETQNPNGESSISWDIQCIDGEEDGNGANDRSNSNKEDIEESFLAKMKRERNADEIHVEHDEMKEDYEFEKIVNHVFENGTHVLKVRYQSNTIGEDSKMNVLFDIPRKNVLVAVARYIKECAVEALKRHSPYNK